MATAYASFCRPLDLDTATQLIIACKGLVSEVKQDTGKSAWDDIHLSIACGGGSIIAGFAAFNELNGLPVQIITHNVGTVDSAAILLFMTGKRRYATPHSAFQFHQQMWTFGAKEELTLTVLNDAVNWLRTYQRMMCEIVAANTTLTAARVAEMMEKGTILNPQEARECGLIEGIEERTIPRDSRWHQV